MERQTETIKKLKSAGIINYQVELSRNHLNIKGVMIHCTFFCAYFF